MAEGSGACRALQREPLFDVLLASQLRIPSAGTQYGKTPYSVSLAECEWRSMARNVFMQNAAVRMTASQPIAEAGR